MRYLLILLAGLSLSAQTTLSHTGVKAFQDQITVPLHGLTPGAIGSTNPAVVCVAGYSDTIRKTTEKLKAKVWKKYGVPADKHSEYTLDHLVPLQLGGADVFANLWPQPKQQALEKDRIEDSLHRDACSAHSVTLANAQHIFKTNGWVQTLYAGAHKTP